MAAKTERFELRLDSETIAELDRWSGAQSDTPSRAESVRRLIKSGLGSSSQQQFLIMQFQLLSVARQAGTRDSITDASVFAWLYEIYPFHDSAQEHWAKPFATHFSISPSMMEELAGFLDGLWLNRKTITFYELEDHYQVRQGRTKWDRAKLINACRYMFLEDMFGAEFWEGLLAPVEHPTEAKIINLPFDRDKDIRLG